jgi:electron transfer flavoprotein beta subunit
MLIVKGYRRKRRLVKCFLNRSSAFDLRGFRSQAIIDGRTRKSAGTGLLCATQHTNLVPLQAIASPKGVAIPFPGDCFVALLLAMTSYLFRLCLINETGKISKYMKILVCIKQVPDCFETLRIDERTGLLSFPPDSAFRMNRFDEFALEEALLIKERFSGTVVHGLSVGPERVRATLQRAMGMGADHSIHVLDSNEGYISPFTVAFLIAASVRPREYDLIMTGVMAEDTMACQTGQLIAGLLNLPCATSVIKEEVDPDEGLIVLEREIEGGNRERLRLNIPAVLTIQPGINLPRYPSFSKVMRARNYTQEIIRAEELPTVDARESYHGLRFPEATSQGLLIEGSPREKAIKLINILHGRSLLS